MTSNNRTGGITEMKKIVALLLAVMMLMSVSAFAEETVSELWADGEVVTQEVTAEFELDLHLDGYTVTDYPMDDGLLVSVLPTDADATKTSFVLSVAFSEEFINFTLPVRTELDDETYAELCSNLAVNYNAPEFSYIDQTDKNGDGVGAVIVDETEMDAGDLGEVFSVWNGYTATVKMVNLLGQISDEDLEIAGEIVKALKVTEVTTDVTDYYLYQLDSVGTIDPEWGVESDLTIWCVDVYSKMLTIPKGEEVGTLSTIGEDDGFLRMILTEDATILVPVDVTNPVENQILESNEAFSEWFDANFGAGQDKDSLLFRYALNDAEEVIFLEYIYLP